ncbi:MAG: tRNA (adenosine(37)-N6)-threonylcarbamoyltransferase complex ATPase subunit type 1 TsaE [Patescibacteria group bacterium]
MTVFVSRGPSQTKKLAKRILVSRLKAASRPAILALRGELGSGKTTFIQGLARALGIREKIQSPTFVIMKWYVLPRRFQSFRHLVHLDAYRLERAKEAKHLGLDHIFQDPDAIIVVEWAERIKRLIPKSAYWIKFQHGEKPHERIIQLRIQMPKFKMQEAAVGSNENFSF